MEQPTDRLIIVSMDGHAQPPPEMWPEYLEARYHEYLPSLHEEHLHFRELFKGMILDRIYGDIDLFDTEGVFRRGRRGLDELAPRLEEMDREGIAAEYVYFGDPSQVSLFFANSNRVYPFEVREAGVRAWHRWLHDTFGAAHDRVYLVGIVGCGPCADMDSTLTELDWIADRGFVGTFAPGYTTYPDQPPLFDEYWDPFWARCVERDLTLVVHAGHGPAAGRFAAEVEAFHGDIVAAGGATPEVLERHSHELLADDFFSKLLPRRAMGQILLGGVFDRYPEARLLMTEVRGDWLPATLAHLDTVYDAHRDELPAVRRPSEYWESNCMTSLSFVHRAEIEMRHELGVDTIGFGRDYPHPEGTWPNTRAWLHDAFTGVPDDEVRMMLGENAIRILGLDRASLAEIAARVGPTIADITGFPDVDPALIEHFDLRGGYLKPAEGAAQIARVDQLVREDWARAGVSLGT